MPRRHATALFAALSVPLTAGAAPSEVRLLPVGRFAAGDGSGRPAGIAAGWLLDDAAAAALTAQAARRASDFVIDFEHQTLHAANNGQPAPAAGWFKELQLRPDDGLYAVDVRWTARAAAMIGAGEYRYLSPTFNYAPDGRVLALGPAALTNNPGLDGLTDLSRAALSALFSQEESPMKDLLKALGLAETATEAEALAALSALRGAHSAALTAAATAVATPDPARFVGVAVLAAVQGELAAANTQLAALTASQRAAEVDAIVTEALAAGKLTPATQEWAAGLGKSDLAALKAFVSAAPVVLKPGETQTGGNAGKGADGSSQPSDADRAVMKALGLTAEQFAAGKPQET